MQMFYHNLDESSWNLDNQSDWAEIIEQNKQKSIEKEEKRNNFYRSKKDLFIQNVFIEHLLYSRCCSKLQRIEPCIKNPQNSMPPFYSNEREIVSRKNKLGL